MRKTQTRAIRLGSRAGWARHYQRRAALSSVTSRFASLELGVSSPLRPWHRAARPGILVMNRMERRPAEAGEAKVEFLDGDFRIVRPGAFVRCAVTGAADPARGIALLERRPTGGLRQPRRLDEAREREQIVVLTLGFGKRSRRWADIDQGAAERREGRPAIGRSRYDAPKRCAKEAIAGRPGERARSTLSGIRQGVHDRIHVAVNVRCRGAAGPQCQEREEQDG